MRDEIQGRLVGRLIAHKGRRVLRHLKKFIRDGSTSLICHIVTSQLLTYQHRGKQMNPTFLFWVTAGKHGGQSTLPISM